MGQGETLRWGKDQRVASQDETSGAAAPLTIADCAWAPLGAQLLGEHSLCSRSRDCHSTEELRELPTQLVPRATQLVTGRLEFEPRAVGLPAPYPNRDITQPLPDCLQEGP